jgi:hypothetical protein
LRQPLSTDFCFADKNFSHSHAALMDFNACAAIVSVGLVRDAWKRLPE